jgi:probable O-glycosylation ligase (exosortase A-associated)
VAIGLVIVAAVMPQSWYDRMHTIRTYEEDESALGRINAWHTAFNVAKDRVVGGGYEMFRPPTFSAYAPEPYRVHDAHSIYFEVMGEHGFVGLVLFLLIGIFTWFRAQQVVRVCRSDPERKWASDLASMVQVSLVGYAVGGAFLGLAYFDLPYHLMIIVVLTAKFSGVLGQRATVELSAQARPARPPAGRFTQDRFGQRL